MDYQDYLQIFSKRKWVIIVSFLSVFLGAGVYVLTTPKTYKSTTTILIVPQRVPENYVRSTVTVGAEGRLATLQQQVTSRTRLLKVMTELGLFQKELKEEPQEDVIEKMTGRIGIDIVQDRRQDRARDDAEAFSISFEHEDPKLAMLTASRLASTYIDENVRSREHQAVGTSQLIESQLKETKAKLDAQEDKVKRYKTQFMGSLPQELQANLNTLTRLQQQYSTTAIEISDLEKQKFMLQSQLSLIEQGPQAIVHEDGRAEIDTSQEAAQTLTAQLALRRSQLAEISAKYSDRYPDVIRLRKEIEQLEKKLLEAQASASASSRTKKDAPKSSVYMPLTGKGREDSRRVKGQLAQIDSEIAVLKTERGNIQRKIAVSQARVEQAPRHEQELVSLTMDYENLKKSHDDLVKKKMEADLSQQVELRQKGEQYRILDPANLPERPFKPKKGIILACAMLMAGVLGFGGSILMERMDLSLRGVTDFKHYFDIPVLACIPVLESDEIDRRQKFRRKAFLTGAISFALFLFALIVMFGDKLRGILNN
jgi:polysaccharide chain length determinant protein (PEP-CTERM system associated)